MKNLYEEMQEIADERNADDLLESLDYVRYGVGVAYECDGGDEYGYR